VFSASSRGVGIAGEATRYAPLRPREERTA
jgi:hypothetical protein